MPKPQGPRKKLSSIFRKSALNGALAASLFSAGYCGADPVAPANNFAAPAPIKNFAEPIATADYFTTNKISVPETVPPSGGAAHLSDNALMDLVQKQTLAYFRDYAHPVSGMARERDNLDPDCVATGGTGFGIMALIAGTERGWVPRQELLERVTKIVDFLGGADKYHGVFPHFINGNTGKMMPFSAKDDGGDLVETSYLMMGLLSARQYFLADPSAATLCTKINTLWQNVEWDWYNPDHGSTLYWHWSADHSWWLPVQGWDECLITHVLANASPTHPVSPSVYAGSWAEGRDFINGKSYDGIDLPLGPPEGGPLFFSYNSFLGLNPASLKDQYADYWQQNRDQVLIDRAYCIDNPNHYIGYGTNCWGLTASDDPKFYDTHSPGHDTGVISPVAAISSFPYAPEYAMQAMRHFYEDLGKKTWGPYGFFDAFSESQDWYAKSDLAIDEGPIVVMIENYRSGLLWNLFMSCPEVKHGLETLNFQTLPPPPATPSAKTIQPPRP